MVSSVWNMRNERLHNYAQLNVLNTLCFFNEFKGKIRIFFKSCDVNGHIEVVFVISDNRRNIFRKNVYGAGIGRR